MLKNFFDDSLIVFEVDKWLGLEKMYAFQNYYVQVSSPFQGNDGKLDSRRPSLTWVRRNSTVFTLRYWA